MFEKKEDKVTGTSVPRWTFTSIRKDGKDYSVTTVRNPDGTIIGMTFTDKHSYR